MHRTKVKLSTLCFFSAYTLFIITKLIGSSLYNRMLPSYWQSAVNLLIVIILIAKWAFCERLTYRKFIVCASVFLVTSIVVLRAQYGRLFISIFLVMSGRDIEFRKIVKWTAIEAFLIMLFVFVSCKVGILRDYTYTRFGGIAHSYGFLYYSSFAYLSMLLTISFCYLQKEKIKYRHILILIVLNYLMYKLHTTRLTLVVIYAFLFLYVIIYKFHWVVLKKRIWLYVATLMPLVMFVLTFALVLMYQQGNFALTNVFYSTLISRLRFSAQALDEYGVHLFGTHLSMVGNVAMTYGDAEQYFYVDSAYIYTVIAYGLVFSVVLMILYTVLYRYIYRVGDQFAYLWLAVMLIACVVNNFIVSPIYNPLLFMIPEALLKRGIDADVPMGAMVKLDSA